MEGPTRHVIMRNGMKPEYRVIVGDKDNVCYKYT